MPRVKVCYTLPEEEHELHAALRGNEAAYALYVIDQHCRNVIKHGDPPPEVEALAQAIRDLIPAEFIDP